MAGIVFTTAKGLTSKMRGPGLSEQLSNEGDKLFYEFLPIYRRLFPKDDGDFDALLTNYLKANASKELQAALKRTGWKT